MSDPRRGRSSHRRLFRLAVLWIRGMVILIMLLAAWLILRTAFPQLGRDDLSVEALAVVLVGLIVLPPVLGMLSRLFAPAVTRLTGGGIQRWEDRIVQEFAPDDKRGFPVVLVPWPNERVRTPGLVTNTFPNTTGEGRLAVVFLPNTPKARTGNLRILPEEDLIHTSWTFMDMIQFQLSFGSSSPTELWDTELPRLAGEDDDS